MKLTIIETGLAPAPIRDRFPSYPEMFRKMFETVGAGFACETVALARGEALPDVSGIEALVYTGSPAGVYEDEPWIAPLMTFIQTAAAQKRPQVGICFGHQAMAQALGGKVEKSDKGWCTGQHRYELMATPGLGNTPAPSAIRVAASHQDQVVVKPAAADVVARSDFTSFAGLSYRDFPALSFQCHPEFDPEFSAALYNARRGVSLSEAEADAAIASLAEEGERRFLAEWITAFLKTGLKRGPASV